MRASRATRQPRSRWRAAAVMPVPGGCSGPASARLAGRRAARAMQTGPDVIASLGRYEYPREAGSVRRARDDIRKALAEWGFNALTDDVVLCVSEAVTNSVQHACTPFRTVSVMAWYTGAAVRIEVIDGDWRRPRRSAPTEAGAGTRPAQSRLRDDGRGIFLISKLAARWGVTPYPPGKRVWFEFSTKSGA